MLRSTEPDNHTFTLTWEAIERVDRVALQMFLPQLRPSALKMLSHKGILYPAWAIHPNVFYQLKKQMIFSLLTKY